MARANIWMSFSSSNLPLVTILNILVESTSRMMENDTCTVNIAISMTKLMEQNETEWSRVMQNGADWSRVEYSGAEWSKVELGGAKWSKVEQGGAEWSQTNRMTKLPKTQQKLTRKLSSILLAKYTKPVQRYFQP